MSLFLPAESSQFYININIYIFNFLNFFFLQKQKIYPKNTINQDGIGQNFVMQNNYENLLKKNAGSTVYIGEKKSTFTSEDKNSF